LSIKLGKIYREKMGDTEFEEFRQYFDRLPQYIKAPAQIYT